MLNKIKRLFVADYYKNNKAMQYVLTDKDGYKYYAHLDYKNMHSIRYSNLYLPKMIELSTKITESDMLFFLEKCEKFNTIQQYRDAHAIIKYKSHIMFNPSTIWELAAIALHRQDEKGNEISNSFHKNKIESIKLATIGGVADFFQLLGLSSLLNLEDLSEISWTILTENMTKEIQAMETALTKISLQT